MICNMIRAKCFAVTTIRKVNLPFSVYRLFDGTGIAFISR